MITSYTAFTIGGIIAGAVVARLMRDGRTRGKINYWFFIAAAFGIVIGAKLPLLITYGLRAEFLHTGKSFCGGLVGAFVAVNLYKFFARRRNAALGGRFVVPLAVAAGVGKIGCAVNGCCGGVGNFPAQIFESAFQFLCAIGLYVYYRKTGRLELLFPLYMALYLVMRFAVEFVRVEPRVALGLTVYQFIALGVLPFVFFIIHNRSKNCEYEYR